MRNKNGRSNCPATYRVIYQIHRNGSPYKKYLHWSMLFDTLRVPRLYEFLRDARTNCHRLVAQNSRNVFSHGPEARSSASRSRRAMLPLKALENNPSLCFPWHLMAILGLWLHLAISLPLSLHGLFLSRVSVCSLLFFFF